MNITMLYFGVLKDLLGRERGEIEVPKGCSVATLLETVEASAPGKSELWRTLAVAVNREYVRSSAVLHEGDEVALLPPVSGGCDAR